MTRTECEPASVTLSCTVTEAFWERFAGLGVGECGSADRNVDMAA